MLKKWHLGVVFLLTLFAVIYVLAEDTQIISSDMWTPPNLSDATADSTPELLVLKVAQEEVGYIEGPRNDESKYGKWFGDERCAWCAEFITWCVNEADERYGTSMLRSVLPYYGSSKDGTSFFIKKGRFISDDGKLPTNEKQWLIGSSDYMESNGYMPRPGDYMWLYYYSRRLGPDHVALVEGLSRDDDGTIVIHVIEGNNPDRVQRNQYLINNKLIYGFGTIDKRAYANIRLYSIGDDVKQLKEDLIRLNYLGTEYAGKKDIVDYKIQSAVMRFQKDKGLTVTKIVDIDTRNALDVALAVGILAED